MRGTRALDDTMHEPIGFSGVQDGAEHLAAVASSPAQDRAASQAGCRAPSDTRCRSALPRRHPVFGLDPSALYGTCPAAPLERAPQLEHFATTALAFALPSRVTARVNSFSTRHGLVQLAHEHQDRLHHVERLEAGDDHGLAIFLGEVS